jgi:hypothetical protein
MMGMSRITPARPVGQSEQGGISINSERMTTDLMSKALVKAYNLR